MELAEHGPLSETSSAEGKPFSAESDYGSAVMAEELAEHGPKSKDGLES